MKEGERFRIIKYKKYEYFVLHIPVYLWDSLSTSYVHICMLLLN